MTVSIFRTLEKCLALAITVLIFAALVASASKMGVLSGTCGVFVVGFLALRRTFAGWPQRFALTGLAAGLLFFIVFVPSDRLMKGFGTLLSDGTGEGRYLIWADTLRLIRNYPLMGCGLGNFETGFVKFQTEIIDRNITFAHNDYLEVASELGAAGTLIAAAFFAGIFWSACRVSRQGRERNAEFFGAGCLGAMTAIAVHSLADFNLYIPANAMLLAWISGMSASSVVPTENHAKRWDERQTFFKTLAVFLSLLLITYASVWILFEKNFHGDQRLESLFCRFGICDTDVFLATQRRDQGGKTSTVPLPALVEALRRSSASPVRWCDLGEAISSHGRAGEAKYCFSMALSLGPYLPPVVLRAANFHFSAGDSHSALRESSRILEKTDSYDDLVFRSYGAHDLPMSQILEYGMPPGPRAVRAYLGYQMDTYNQTGASTVWNWAIAHHFTNDRLAQDYVNFLFSCRKYEPAAHALASYLGSHHNFYLHPNWVFNGDFELTPLRIPLDWQMENLGEDVKVARDPSVAHTGSYSLRITFEGNANVNYSQTSQKVFVTPGRYRFEAFVRTQGLTTDKGIGFRIFDAEQPYRWDLRTDQVAGTNDWKKVEELVTVPSGTRLLVIQIIRESSWKFDSLIKGTAWIDGVALVKLQ